MSGSSGYDATAAVGPLPEFVGTFGSGAAPGGGSFIVGEENRLSSAAALLMLHDAARADEVARRPIDDGERASPDAAFSTVGGLLVLHGSSGTGKSLLCDLLVDDWNRRLPHHAIVRLDGAEFARRYAQAVDADEVARFRAELRAADLLVLEDLQRLGTKRQAQFELSHTLDALERRGSYVVATLDVPPPKLSNVPAALVGRLSAGLVVSTAPPSASTRRALVERFAAARRWVVDDKVLDLLAADHESGVPELLGTMASLETAARIEGTPLDAAAVRRYLEHRTETVAPTLKAIVDAAARQFGLTVGDLKSSSRRRTAVAARDAAMFLARRLTNSSLQEIGAFFGGRDHTTVLHGIRKLEAALPTDANLRQTMNALRSRVAKTHPE